MTPIVGVTITAIGGIVVALIAAFAGLRRGRAEARNLDEQTNASQRQGWKELYETAVANGEKLVARAEKAETAASEARAKLQEIMDELAEVKREAHGCSEEVERLTLLVQGRYQDGEFPDERQ